MEITQKNNPFINNVNININHPGSISVSKTQKNNDNSKTKQNAKHTFINTDRDTHRCVPRPTHARDEGHLRTNLQRVEAN